MKKTSLSEIINEAWEEIKGYVLEVLKEVVERMLKEEQDKVLGRQRYERSEWKAWRWGYRYCKNFMTLWGNLESIKIPGIRERGKEVNWLERNERRIKEIGEWIFSAVDFVYPFAKRQICLVHLAKNLERHLKDRGFTNRKRFRREFWWIYEAITKEEAIRFYERFKERWRDKEKGMVLIFERYFPMSPGYYTFPEGWMHRVRTTNLAENFFRNLWRFMSRFPGFQDEGHSLRVLGIYLLGVERLRREKEVLPYAL